MTPIPCEEQLKFERAARSLAFDQFAEALANFQDEVPAPEKNKFNSHLKTKYADLSCVITTIRPFLRKHGFVYSQPLDFEKDQVIVYTEVIHQPSGQWIRSRLGMSLSDTKPQTHGIVISYARRYSLLATLAMPHDDEDNDGDLGEKKPAKDSKYQQISVSEPKPAEAPKGNSTSKSTAKSAGQDSRSASVAGKGASSAALAEDTSGRESLVKKATGLFGGRILDSNDDTRLGAHLAADAKDDLWDLCLQLWPSETKSCLNKALAERNHKPVDFRNLNVGQGLLVHSLVSELLGNDGSEAPF